MEFRKIKIGNYYKTRVMGHVVKVKVVKKEKTENFYRIEYIYVDGHPIFSDTKKGIQFSKTSNFPNVNAAD